MITRFLPRVAFIAILAVAIWGVTFLAYRMNGPRFLEMGACWTSMAYVGAGWLLAWFGSVRRSPGTVAMSFVAGSVGGVLLGFLVGQQGILPGVLLGCVAIALILGSLLSLRMIQHGWLVVLCYVVVTAASCGVAIFGAHFLERWNAHIFVVLCVISGVGILFRRSRRQSAASITMILLSIVLVAGLYTLTVIHETSVEIRSLFYGFLMSVPFLMAGVALEDVLRVEKELKTGIQVGGDSSMIDALTRVSSRRALDVFGPQLCKQSYQTERPVSILMLDVDHFKQINDTHGHAVGDAALRHLSSVVSGKVRASDLVGRLGGDEFVVVLPGSPLAPAMRLAEAIRAAVNESHFEAENAQVRLSTSIGVVTSFPEDAMDFGQLLSRADANLYRAKRAGRNRAMADAVPYE